MNNGLQLGKVSNKTYVSVAIGPSSNVAIRKFTFQFVRNERRSQGILLAVQENCGTSKEDGNKG